MDNEAHHVVLGAVEHSTRLLDLRWGHGEFEREVAREWRRGGRVGVDECVFFWGGAGAG